MSTFNRNKFLNALLDLSAPPAPLAPRPNGLSFAKFMAAKTYGASDFTDAAIVAAKNEQQNDADREEGALSKTFGWMMSGMSGVQNVIQDAADSDLSLGEKASNIFLDVAGTAAHAIQPIAEIAAIPGVKTPWEPEGLTDFIEAQNVQHHGEGTPVHGSDTLKKLGLQLDPYRDAGKFYKGPPIPNTTNQILNSVLGLGVDVATDPLSYVGIGLLPKLRSGKELLELGAAASEVPKVAETTEKVASGSAKAFTKPTTPQVAHPPVYRSLTKPETGVGDISGVLSPTQRRLMIDLGIQQPLDAAALRSIRASHARNVQLYDKLHPVVVPEKLVPKRPEFAGVQAAGESIVEGFPEFNTLDNAGHSLNARPLTRDEQTTIFSDVMDMAVEHNLPTQTVAQQKYLMKGAEDALEKWGFTFPEGRLSSYLHSTKDTSLENLTAFAKGKPLKEAPMDASLERKLEEARTAQGRSLLEGKLSKTRPGAVVTPFGINSREVARAIENIETGAVGEKAYVIPKAQGAPVIKAAVDAAEAQKGLLGRMKGKTTIAKNMNPANQANLYNRLYNATIDLIKENPEMLKRFRNKKGQLVHDSVPARRWRRETALTMLKTAEEHLAKTHNLKGQGWDGTGLRLSSVIEELGPGALEEHLTKVLDAFHKGDPSKVTDPIAKAAITQAIARRNIETGGVAKVILDGYVDKAKIMERELSHQKFLEWKNKRAIPQAKRDATMAGLSEEEARRVIDLVKNQVNVEGLELYEPMHILDTIGARTVEAVRNGTADHKLIAQVGRALQEMVDETPKMQRTDIKATTVLDTVLGLFTTWWGRGDMIHYAREAGSYVEDAAKARASWFNNIAKNYTPKEIEAAFMHAQGHFENVELAMAEQGVKTPIIEPHIETLSHAIKDYFETVMASSRTINDIDALKGSVAVRANVMMDDVNKHLRSAGSTFQFRNSVRRNAKNVKGNPAGGGVGYAGDDWWRSWENVDATKLGQDPLHFMYDLDIAMSKTTMEYSMIDDFVRRFGRKPGEADFQSTMSKGHHHHRIDPDIRFEPEVIDAFDKLLKDIEKGSWFPQAPLAKAFVKGQRMWKTGVTQYNPSFHIRNGLGDTWLMWLAGHNDPRMFAQATRMIAANKARYEEALNSPTLEMLQGMISKEEYGLWHSNDSTVILNKYGADLTSRELYGEAIQRGLLPDADRASDIIGEPLFAHTSGRNPSALRRFAEKPLGGHAHRAAMKATELREHTIRLAHFNSVINKNITRKMAARLKAINEDDNILNKVAARREVLEKVYEKASREVRKWHPDGRDLSYFEQKYMRQIIPFYSWQRKIVPLLAESMLIRPAKITAYPKGMFALQQALGIESPGIQDPFPTDQLFPDFLRGLGVGPIGDPQSQNAMAAWWGKLGRNEIVNGQEQGYTVINPGNPFNDTVTSYFGTDQTFMEPILKGSSMLTPAFNIPKELLSDKKWTGAPISKDEGGAGYGNWLLGQAPILSMGNRVLNIGAKEQENVEPGMDKEALLNILTALGIKGTGQYTKFAEFDAERAAKKKAEGR